MTPSKSQRHRLAIIEDDLDLQEILAAYFRQRNFDVTTFCEPMKLLNDPKLLDGVDVVISDLFMPQLSGIELIKRLKVHDPSLPIILATANQSVDTAIEAIDAGAYDFVVKPIHFVQLYISVKRAIHFRHLQKENSNLRAVLNVQHGEIDGIIGKSQAFRAALEMAKRVANSTATVLITGESGTGKEVIAKVIHRSGDRKDKPFIAINCSAIPENLLESELFGYVKGAFTGAADKKLGLFEEANGGTLFLDEIGDLSQPLQAKLLRVLQEKQVKRLGENQTRDVDVRVLAATHKDLRQSVEDKTFREDLYFRLNVIPIRLPPLVDRKEDILPLAEFFLRKYCTLGKIPPKTLSRQALDYLLQLPWKGNVRELENAIERAVVLSRESIIQVEDLPDMESIFGVKAPEKSNASLRDLNFMDMGEGEDVLPIDELNKKYIRFVLQRNNGAKETTAKMLGIDRKTLYRKLQELEM